jgi:hypothetical protein
MNDLTGCGWDYRVYVRLPDAGDSAAEYSAE